MQVISTEEFIFINTEGKLYKEETNDLKKYRHGDIAYNYMKKENLQIHEVDINQKNGYLWGIELAKFYSIFVIHVSNPFSIIYIPQKLTKEQIDWIEKNIKEVINKLNTEIFICDFVDNTEINYLYFKENIENKLCNYLKTKGVNIGGNEYNGKCKQLYL